MQTTQSKEEALALLQKYRSDLIERGREIAVEIARYKGEVHSRDVRDTLKAEGRLTMDIDERFLGAVFSKRGLFVKTGREHKAQSTERNIHSRPIPIWKLA